MNFILKTTAMFVLCYVFCMAGMGIAHANTKIELPTQKTSLTQPTLNLAEDTISIDVPKTFMGMDNLAWDQIAELLRTTGAKNIILRITGYGGDIMTGNLVVRSIQDAQAQGKKIYMDVIGPAYSMHAYLTCFTQNVQLRDGASLMFHKGAAYGSTFFGFVNYSTPINDQTGKVLESYLYGQCAKIGRLYPADIEQIKKGNAVVVSNEGGSIVTYYTINSFTSLDTISDILLVIAFLAALIVLVGKLVHAGSIGWHRGKKGHK